MRKGGEQGAPGHRQGNLKISGTDMSEERGGRRWLSPGRDAIPLSR